MKHKEKRQNMVRNPAKWTKETNQKYNSRKKVDVRMKGKETSLSETKKKFQEVKN